MHDILGRFDPRSLYPDVVVGAAEALIDFATHIQNQEAIRVHFFNEERSPDAETEDCLALLWQLAYLGR